MSDANSAVVRRVVTKDARAAGTIASENSATADNTSAPAGDEGVSVQETREGQEIVTRPKRKAAEKTPAENRQLAEKIRIKAAKYVADAMRLEALADRKELELARIELQQLKGGAQ